MDLLKICSDYRDILKHTFGDDPFKIVPYLYADNILIGGKNNYNCSMAKPGQDCFSNAGISKYNFEKGKSHLLRLINGGAEG